MANREALCPYLDPECCQETTEDRVIGETGRNLQSDKGWHLEDHDNDDGPVILHVKCGTYLCDLNRLYPRCRHCGATIPPSMISGFTMLNWNKADDDEYFVPVGNEAVDFAYNGHLQLDLRELVKLPNTVITEELLTEYMKEKGLK